MPREENAKDRTVLVPQCPKCHNAHLGECCLGTACDYYNCGNEGHIAHDCNSAPANATKPSPRGRPNARVYSLNEGDIAVGPSTSVSGQLPISNMKLFTLIDLRATHSFINKRLGNKLDGGKRMLSSLLITITPAEEVYKSTSWFTNVPIKIGEFI